jgi:DNA (cytosine-5)-methyltransferase 1
MKTIKAIDLFAGCGGLSQGLANAGIDIVLAVDNWKPAVDIYEKNFDHPIINMDLSNVDESVKQLKKYKPDMIVGGPPCQDFSHAGKRDVTRGRADLTVSFARIVTSIKPKFFIMENVDQIVKADVYKEALSIFREAGYAISAQTLDASYFGAPQKRKRHIVVGSLEANTDNFLTSYLEKIKSARPMTVRDYFGDSLGVEHYYRHPRNYNRRGVYSIDEPSATIRGVNRPIASGYPGHKNDTEKDLSKVRPLTEMERCMIQTFPKDFKLVGSKTNIEQAIGNAVPVKLAESVGNAIQRFREDLELNEIEEPLNVIQTSLAIETLAA